VQFLNTMTTREDMDEIDLFGTKVPRKSATVNAQKFVSFDMNSRFFRSKLSLNKNHFAHA